MTPDELRQVIREELIAAGVGESPALPAIYDPDAEQLVLSAILEGQVTLEELAPMRAGHCMIPWVYGALTATGTLEERLDTMRQSFSQAAIDQVQHLHDWSPIVPIQRVHDAAAKVAACYRRRTLALACNAAADKLAHGGDGCYDAAVKLLRETVLQLQHSR